jgi:hypothetical protein
MCIALALALTHSWDVQQCRGLHQRPAAVVRRGAAAAATTAAAGAAKARAAAGQAQKQQPALQQWQAGKAAVAAAAAVVAAAAVGAAAVSREPTQQQTRAVHTAHLHAAGSRTLCTTKAQLSALGGCTARHSMAGHEHCWQQLHCWRPTLPQRGQACTPARPAWCWPAHTTAGTSITGLCPHALEQALGTKLSHNASQMHSPGKHTCISLLRTAALTPSTACTLPACTPHTPRAKRKTMMWEMLKSKVTIFVNNTLQTDCV